MKNHKYIFSMLCGLALLVTACTDSDSPTSETQTADNWVLSRSQGSTVESLRMVGIPQNGGTAFNKTLTFESNEGEWEGGVPTWNKNDVFDLYALYPTDAVTNDIVDTRIAYQMQYWSGRTKNNRPTAFKLKHLHGQLLVHIDIDELDTEEHEPQDVQIRLHGKGRINYPNEKLDLEGDKEWKTLDNWDHDAGDNHKWVMSTPITVIPQTLAMDGKPVVTFYIEDDFYGIANYEFTPTANMTLAPGKLTHLYLGIVYKHEEGEEPQPVVVVKDITVTDWETGTETNGTLTPQ